MPHNSPLLWHLHGSLFHKALVGYPTWPGSEEGILGRVEEAEEVTGGDHFSHPYADEQSDDGKVHKYHEVWGGRGALEA